MTRALPPGTVTLLFTDIEGSTRLLDAAGDGYGTILADHRRLLRSVWSEFGGFEVDTEGDAFFVSFASATSAVAAAAEGQRRLAGHDWPPGQAVRVRMGLHTGEPRIQDGGYWGSVVHYGARIAAAAHGGQVLMSATTRPLVDVEVESLGEHVLKDFATPREIFHIVIDGLGADAFPPPRTPIRARTNLPRTGTSILGRDDELAELEQLCGSRSLVTITGPGGSGKTRLLLELGARAAAGFDEVWFVPLEQVTDPDLLAASIARVVGLPESPGDEFTRVLDHLRTRRVLLLLDNLEQIIEAAPLVARLSAIGPDVRVVSTSQPPLRVSGEHVFRLGPLRLPTHDDPAGLGANPAVALLVERATAVGAGFRLDPANAADIVTLCAQLEGMPLALELAGARLSLLTPAEISHRLERGLDALGKGGRDLPPRQRGLRAALEWTCDLLSEEQRALLGRLSVFVGGFSVNVLGEAFDDALDDLGGLIDVALVQRGAGGRLNCRPPVRRFAAELLHRDGDPVAAQAAMVDCLAALAEPFERLWFIVAGEGHLAVDPDATNIVAALDWARDHDPVRHARLSAATGWWMTHANFGRFGISHVETAVARTEDPWLRARCLQSLGALGFARADPTASLDAAEAWHQLGDAPREVMSLVYAANLYSHQGNSQAGLPLVDRAADLADGLGDAPISWLVDMMRSQALGDVGRRTEARAIVEPHLDTVEPGSWQEAMTSTLAADIALADGRAAAALRHYVIALRLLGTTFGSEVGALVQADTITLALARLGRCSEAATSLAVCELAHRELGWPPRGNLARALEDARSLLDEAQLVVGRREAADLGRQGGLRWLADLSTDRGASALD